MAVQSQGAWRANLLSGGKSGWRITGPNEGLSGSVVRFTVVPPASTPAGQASCDVVLVEYHNYRCTHKIALRQDYDPVEVAGKRWLLNNVEYVEGSTAYVSDCPLNEGSMFRYGNIAQAIDAINNTYHPNVSSRTESVYKTYAFFDSNNNGRYLLAPVNRSTVAEKDAAGNVVNTYATWGAISPSLGGFSQKGAFTVRCGASELPGTYRMAEYADFQVFRNDNRLYGNYGAIYWFGTTKLKAEMKSDHEVYGYDESDQHAWDLNYSSFDFSPIPGGNLHCDGASSISNASAAFIRLIQE